MKEDIEKLRVSSFKKREVVVRWKGEDQKEDEDQEEDEDREVFELAFR